LEYRLEWDRDLLLKLAASIRQVFWPISICFAHPAVLFVLIVKTRMDIDCKAAFVIHDVINIILDVYNGFFYQLYTLFPYPIFCCTGLLCTEEIKSRALLTILSFLTIAQCVPYLFVMMRLHQKMLFDNHIFKLSKRSQLILMVLFSVILASNVYGFGAFCADSAERDAILKNRSIAWVAERTNNILVLGRQYGEIGQFTRGAFTLRLTSFTIVVIHSFSEIWILFVSILFSKFTFQHSKTFQIQLRFMVSLSIQACLTSIFFILPLTMLMLAMVTPIATVIRGPIIALIRMILVV
ncbi:hypothetical protein PMAYCL1PPCAC_04838, partial [Pristionchus mayeri]